MIEATVTVRTDGRHRRTTHLRLITALLDRERYPATELAELHHERWEVGTAHLGLKVTLRGPGRVLRSQAFDRGGQPGQMTAHTAQDFLSPVRSSHAGTARWHLVDHHTHLRSTPEMALLRGASSRIEEFFNSLVAVAYKSRGKRSAVGGFTEALQERVHNAREAVAAALAAEDAYEMALAQGELDDALRLARKHGIDVGAEEG
ncbi:hypothetical protein ACWCPS_38180 [Streptomyces mauvecolor]